MDRFNQTRIDRRSFLGATGALALAGTTAFAPRWSRDAAAKEGAGFFARPNGNRGELLGYSLEHGGLMFTLPPGILDAGGQRFIAAEPATAKTLAHGGGALFAGASVAGSSGEPTHTRVALYDPYFGRIVDSWAFDGQWRLGGISEDAHWVALTSVPSDAERAEWEANDSWRTEVLLLDSQTGGEPRRITLDGNFEVEVVSAEGEAFFLLEHVPAAHPDHYLVRLYDNLQGGLQPGALRDKRTSDEFMAGLAWDGVASPDGDWLLTLYLSTSKEIAFIHSLNLRDRFPVCIDLPSGTGDFDLLKQYSLIFSPTGQKLFATNTALGVVAHVDLAAWDVAASTTFAPAPPLPNAVKGANSRVTMRPDERTVFFSGGEDLWSYDTQGNAVSGPIRVPGPIIGLDARFDDTWVVVARLDEPLLMVNPTTGDVAPFSR